MISGFQIVESISRPLVIYCDNTVAVHFSQNNRSFTRSKHFDIKFLFVREKFLDYQTRIEHTVTKNMLADPLTKGLFVGVFQNHVTHMGVVKSFWCIGLVGAWNLDFILLWFSWDVNLSMTSISLHLFLFLHIEFMNHFGITYLLCLFYFILSII